MKIGIIGSGNISNTLAKKLTGLGHIVYIANSRGPETLLEFQVQTGAIPVTVKEAASVGEIVIITIPQKNIPDLPSDLFKGVSSNIIVIDTCNYYPIYRDGIIPGLDKEFTDSQWVQHQLGVPVIKVFNSILSLSLADGSKQQGEPDRIGLPVSGDSEPAKMIVMQLVNDLGFDPVDAGTLDHSWRQQPGTSIYCTDLSANKIQSELTKMGSEWTSAQREKIIASRNAQEEFIIKMYSAQQN